MKLTSIASGVCVPLTRRPFRLPNATLRLPKRSISKRPVVTRSLTRRVIAASATPSVDLEELKPVVFDFYKEKIHKSTRNLKGDLFGGFTAAIVALPLALAFGVASGTISFINGR